MLGLRGVDVIDRGSEMTPILGGGFPNVLFKKAGKIKLVAKAVLIADFCDRQLLLF